MPARLSEICFRAAPQHVRAELERILASEEFARSARMQRFLRFIVEETLEGRADQLGEYGIGLAVFDRSPDFEPAIDPIVRNDARRLRGKLHEYYRHANPAPPAGVIVDIPKGGYVPVFLPAADRENAAPRRSRFRVAVLQFEMLSTAPETALYGRALGMSLTAGLTNVAGLEAIAHGFLGDLSIREAARESDLSHAIQGSIVKSAIGWRVVVNLIQMPDGTQLWAREYDFDDGETFECQSEITRSVLREVTIHLRSFQPVHTQLSLAA